MVDGAEVARVAATASGEFAALFTLPPKDTPSLMVLEAVLPDGSRVASVQKIAIAPIVPPVVAAAAEPLVDPVADPVAVAPTDPAAADTAVAAVAPAAVLVTDAGVTVVQPGATPDASVAANVTVEAITYTPSGAVQLGGRAQPGAFVRVYLNGTSKGTVLVPDDGAWLTTLPETDPGIYTLRVDQLDDAGKVTSRFETPFKRETLEALAAVAQPEVAPVVEPATQTEVAAAPEGNTEPAPAVLAPATTATPTAVADPAVPDPLPAADATVVAGAVAPVAPAPQLAEAQPAPAPVSITVQPGFTLWGIAQEKFGDGVLYVQVFEANKDKIRDPDLIYPGQVFTIPQAD